MLRSACLMGLGAAMLLGCGTAAAQGIGDARSAACAAEGLTLGTPAFTECLQRAAPIAETGHRIEYFDSDRFQHSLPTKRPGGCYTFGFSTSGPNFNPVSKANLVCR